MMKIYFFVRFILFLRKIIKIMCSSIDQSDLNSQPFLQIIKRKTKYKQVTKVRVCMCLPTTLFSTKSLPYRLPALLICCFCARVCSRTADRESCVCELVCLRRSICSPCCCRTLLKLSCFCCWLLLVSYAPQYWPVGSKYSAIAL